MIESNQNLEELLFDLAVQKPTTAERNAFLDGVCSGNSALRAALEELLEAHLGAAGFLPKLTSGEGGTAAAPAAASSSAEAASQMLGRYKLLEKIGEGGFGEVWMAEQREPVKRRVALKIIKLGMDTKQVVARFEAERQALAMMDHPNIAKIFDAGATENPLELADPEQSQIKNQKSQISRGRPYFVMELVRGSKITDYCDKNTLSTTERLKLFILVCHAVQHAHQKGIIHRDLKPSNILVTLHDGVPMPKVIDFGIAKAMQFELTDKTLFTQFQQFIGTPAYISPEQAEASGLDIDTRSDIYSLGVLLYELLVGRTPFDPAEMVKGGIDALRQIIREKEPVKPSTRLKTLSAADQTATAQRRQTEAVKLTHQLRGDLDWIVLKCLEKDRNRRYETANGLAMDLQRYLANEPVVARPPSTAYRVQKLVRRNKMAFGAVSVVILALLLGVAAVIIVQHRANHDYRRRLYVSEVNRAGLAWQAGRAAEMRVLLDHCPSDLRHWEWKFLDQQTVRWEGTPVPAITNAGTTTISADGRLLVVAGSEALQIREFPGGRWLRDIPFVAAWNSPFVVSPRGELLATLHNRSGDLTVWNLRTGESVATMNHGGPAEVLGWSADAEWLASGGNDGAIRIWEPMTGREARSLSVSAPVRGLAFAPDGKALAVGTTDKDALLLDAATGSLLRSFRTRSGPVSRLKFSADGRNVVIGNLTFGGFRRDYRVWSLEPQEGSMDLSIGTDALWSDFNRDGRQLAVADASGSIRIWDLDRRVEVERISAHAGFVSSVHWLPDDRILSAGSDGTIRIWQARRPGVVQLKGYPSSLRAVAFSPDGRRLALAGRAREVHLWDTTSAERTGTYTNEASTSAVAFGPDGRAASASDDRTVRVWDAATLETIWSQSIEPAGAAWWVALSPDGQRLYAASHNKTLTVLDAATGRHINAITLLDQAGPNMDGLAVSPDGRLVALCHKVKLVVLRADDLRELWQAAANPDRCVAFSPDSQWLATGDLDAGISLWKVASAGRVHRILRGHQGPVSGVSFHPDGRRLVSCGKDGLVKVWDWRSEVVLLTLPAPGGGMLWHAVFSPDGKTIAAAGGDGVVSLWRVDHE
jgi:WD40 repeat protein/serine/threonine protein kinase